MPNLNPPLHQVAGHRAGEGALGPLIDGAGLFYKPLQGDGRGSDEVAFYTSFSSDARIPHRIRRFFPLFFGTQLLDASDGSGLHLHIVLQDLLSGFSDPSVMDIKIGFRTWYPSCSRAYFEKCRKKDLASTSSSLGFRISGLQTRSDSNFWKPDKATVQRFTIEDVRAVLRKFISSNASSNAEPDCKFASAVYGGERGILQQLMELKAWFNDQIFYHFFSSSVLMMYEKADADGEFCRAEVKLVDFAHVMDANGVIDHNFLEGLSSLIKFISEIIPSSGGG